MSCILIKICIQLSVYESMKVIRLNSSDHSNIEIFIELSDIAKIKQDYTQGLLDCCLRPKACARLNKYLEQFGKIN